MPPKPRWTVPVNMRLEDKPVLDAALEIAKNEGSDITTVIRNALKFFVEAKKEETEKGSQSKFPGEKIEDYLETSERSLSPFQSIRFPIDRLLKPRELDQWSDVLLLSYSKHLRGRKDEIDAALRRRGRFIKW